MCWPWTGARSEKGYGRFHALKARVYRAHRIAFYLATGEWPPAVCHRCDNPPCCNPAHLRAGTPSDNSLEMWSKGRGRPRGLDQYVRTAVTTAAAVSEANGYVLDPLEAKSGTAATAAAAFNEPSD